MKQKATHTTNSTKEIFPFSLEKTITKSSGINFLYVKDNHLGNVKVTVSDRKLPVDDGTYSGGVKINSTPDGIFDFFEPDVISAVDHYPGGFPLPGRSFNGNSYRYGYNDGSEKDDEITGVVGSHFTTYFREFDTRLLIPWSPDPVVQPWQSPYSYMDGNPILINDPFGDCGTCPKDGKAGDTHEWGGSTFTNDGSGNWATDLPEFVMGGGSDGSWSSEVEGNPTFAYGGTLNQYKQDYGVQGSREDIMAAWKQEHGDAWNTYVGNEIQKEKDRVLLEKLSMGLAAFKGIEDLKDVAFVYGTMGVGGSTSMGIGYKSFSYAPRGQALFHYTSTEAAQSIMQSGLRTGKDGFTYLTNNPTMSPIQAQIELALPANRALPNSLLRINTQGMSPLRIGRVQGNLSGFGAGGGKEYLFNNYIRANRITLVK